MTTLLLVLAGCSTTVDFPGDDFGGREPIAMFDPAEIDPLATAVACNGFYTLSMLTTGLGAQLEADLLGPDERVERHALTLSATFAEPIVVDSWDLGPLSVGAPYEDGVATSFTCEDARALTYVVKLYGRGSVLADCIAWGPDRDRAAEFTLQDDILELPSGGCRWFGSLDPGP